MQAEKKHVITARRVKYLLLLPHTLKACNWYQAWEKLVTTTTTLVQNEESGAGDV